MTSSKVVRELPAAHPPEIPRHALDFVARGNPVGQTARNLGISDLCLRSWMARDAVDCESQAGIRLRAVFASPDRI